MKQVNNMKTGNRKFSVVMPAYNAEKTIGESILSVQRQIYQDWELIVVDDHSSDNTSDVVSQIQRSDDRITLIRSSRNYGVAKTRNQALANAEGQYLAFLDADDTWTSDKLNHQYSAFKAGAKVVFGSYRRVFKNNTYQVVRAKPRIDEKIFVYYNPIGNLTGAYDRSIGVVEQKSVRHEDYLMWYEIVRRSRYAVGINEILGDYRVSSTSLSSNKFKAAKWHWQILRDEMKLSGGQATVGFLGYAINTVNIRLSRISKSTDICSQDKESSKT
jgi:glycosyltransferase involved in cell wall biosynthesis